MLCGQHKPQCLCKSVKVLYIFSFAPLLAAFAVCRIRSIPQMITTGKYNGILKELSKCTSEMPYYSVTNLK